MRCCHSCRASKLPLRPSASSAFKNQQESDLNRQASPVRTILKIPFTRKNPKTFRKIRCLGLYFFLQVRFKTQPCAGNTDIRVVRKPSLPFAQYDKELICRQENTDRAIFIKTQSSAVSQNVPWNTAKVKPAP